MTWRIIEEVLSDGSYVYSVTDGEYVFDCIDEGSAHRFMSAIDDCTCSVVDRSFVEARGVAEASPGKRRRSLATNHVRAAIGQKRRG